MIPRLIGHTDADSFYASAERKRTPHLRGSKVCVLGNHGACVIAASYEAKADGVKVGMPIWDAVKICPEAVYVKRDFLWYESLSRSLLTKVRELSPQVEYFSIDEFFFDATRLHQAFPGSLAESIKAMQEHLLNRCGVPMSIGVAPSRTLAKLASKANKPFGCLALTSSGQIEELLQGLPVTKITGIAGRRAKTLARHGITTCDEFVAADRRLIKKLITVDGEKLWYELQGIAVTPINTMRAMHKHVARGGSLGKATNVRLRLEGFVRRNVERLVEALRHYEYVCQTLALDLSYKDRGRRYAAVSLTSATNVTEVIAPAAKELFERCYVPGGFGSYMHLIAGDLSQSGTHQRSLLEPINPQYDSILELVNEKCGRQAVRSAATLALPDIYRDKTQRDDICDVYDKTCF